MSELKYYRTDSEVKGYNPKTKQYDVYVSDTEYVEILRENQTETETN